MTTANVNIIDIDYGEGEERRVYIFENGKWSERIEVESADSGIRETVISTRDCSAEDVITALLNSICKPFTEISTYKRFGSPILVQSWSPWASAKHMPNSCIHELYEKEFEVKIAEQN